MFKSQGLSLVIYDYLLNTCSINTLSVLNGEDGVTHGVKYPLRGSVSPSKGWSRRFMGVSRLWRLRCSYGARLCVTLCIVIMYESMCFTYVWGV